MEINLKGPVLESLVEGKLAASRQCGETLPDLMYTCGGLVYETVRKICIDNYNRCMLPEIKYDPSDNTIIDMSFQEDYFERNGVKFMNFRIVKDSSMDDLEYHISIVQKDQN